MNDDTLLARWLAGELTQDELNRLEKSPNYATLLRVKQQFEAIERPEIIDENMLNTILSKQKIKPVIPLYRKPWFQGIAASIVILLGLILFFSQTENIVVLKGETLAFALPDGSEVKLNSGSKADYNKWNWNNNRNIHLEGEAYFSVAKGKAFTVETSKGSVTVLGTKFNVKVRNDHFEVVCYEGRVRVNYNGEETILTPHKAIVTNSNNKAGNILQTDDNEPKWLSGTLVFNREDFSSITKEIERRFNVEIKAEYQSGKTFTGTLPGNNIQAALDTLALYYPVMAEKQGDKITLKSINAKR